MRIRRTLLFLFQFVTIGLAAAFVIIVLEPGLLPGPRPVVEIHTSPQVAIENRRAALAPQSPRTIPPLSFSGAVHKAAPAVVNIYSAKVIAGLSDQTHEPLLRRFFDESHPDLPGKRVETGLGSGVIFSNQGYVLTNNHVITGADEIQVMLADGRTGEATLVGSDPETDLAVLRITLPNLPAITIGNSDELQVGDVVLAIGNPYGVGQTVTLGIVSATGRKRLGLNTYENFIQTDAAINPGNSGGALVNSNGDLVGVSTAIFSRSGGSQGIGFAIPANLAKGVMTQIIEHGLVTRGWIGISMADVTPEVADDNGLKDALGVVVAAVIRNGPADEAGLRTGDILLRINKENIYDTRQMLDLVARQKPGSQVTLDGIRKGRPFSVQTKVIQRPQLSDRPFVIPEQ